MAFARSIQGALAVVCGTYEVQLRLPSNTLRRALLAHDLQIFRDARNAVLYAATVRFQLRFTFTTAHPNPAFLARQVAPEAR